MCNSYVPYLWRCKNISSIVAKSKQAKTSPANNNNKNTLPAVLLLLCCFCELILIKTLH